MARPINKDPFRAIAHLARRRIIELLLARERSAGEIAAELEMRRPAVSQHLRVLRTLGLVAERVQGNRLIYAVRPRPLASVRHWILRCDEEHARR